MDVRSRRVPSAAFDDGASIRSRITYNPNHRLRPAESRFSLREQFAVTRREYEFGFDDASSVLERSTLASMATRGDELDDTVIVESDASALAGGNLVHRDCYELLCLPRVPSLSPDQVQDAARRLVQVLAVDKQPPRMQSAAAFHLGLAQAAFETLVDPSRRLGYNLSGVEDTKSDRDCDEAAFDEVELASTGHSDTYKRKIQDQYLLLTQRESRATSDLSLRFDVSSLTSQRGTQRHGSGLEVLDLCIRKSATISVPSLRRPMERTVQMLPGLTKAKPGSDIASPLRLADPTVTITGLTHGLLEEPFKLAQLLSERYQPPGPSLHGRRRMEQLLTSRFLPGLSANLRQEVFWRTEPHIETLPDLVVEQEVELLPQLSTTTRICQSFNLPGSGGPLSIEVSAQELLTRRSSLSPSLGLAVHQRVGPGTAFLVADGGDWNLRTTKECRELSKFSRISGGVAPILDAFRSPPTVEVGYAFGRHDLGMPSGQAFTKPHERGLSSLDCDLDESKQSSWTLSTGLTPGIAAAYLRYGRDLFSKPSFSSYPNHRKPTGLRAEAELAATAKHDFFLAFRALKRIGRFTKAGLEIGLSPSNLHLSLYWSRLGQRISIPFLIAAPHRSSRFLTTAATTKLLFWTTVLPFAALAAWELYRQRQRAVNALKRTTLITQYRDKIQEYITQRRTEADELTVILATGVEPRQALQRQHNGLVILSAKYGVRDAPPEEVADVTIAVAALVDDEGKLLIPRGLRKGRLLGFWDPAPMNTKVLRVRYLWQGREGAVEVCGREELRLP